MTLYEQLGKPVLFHWIGSHGKDGHSASGYDSRDPKVISHQLRAMREIGGSSCGVIALTYGPTVSPFIHQAVMGLCHQANALGMPFALCFDPWTVKDAPDKNAAMIAALKHEDTQFMLAGDSYLPGKPVLDFSTGCDKATVTAAVPGIEYWMDGTDYDWVRIPPRPNKTLLPCVYMQFDDGTGADRNKSVWDQSKPVRLVASRAGATFHECDTSAALAYVQFCTWNDYAEQTAIEPFASMLSVEI